MPSLTRSKTAESSSLVSCDGARSTTWQTPPSGLSVLEIQTYPDSSAITPTQRGQLVPPYHWHWYQEENFTVTQGYISPSLPSASRYLHESYAAASSSPSTARKQRSLRQTRTHVWQSHQVPLTHSLRIRPIKASASLKSRPKPLLTPQPPRQLI